MYSAGFRRGFASLFGHDLVLVIGIPLVAVASSHANDAAIYGCSSFSGIEFAFARDDPMSAWLANAARPLSIEHDCTGDYIGPKSLATARLPKQGSRPPQHRPGIMAMAHADSLFDRYTAGFNLAESFYMASWQIHWKDTVIGDPICAPYSSEKAGGRR